jgi:GMP synthase-like glutamine amidotransferase
VARDVPAVRGATRLSAIGFLFIVTEHASFLDESRKREYEQVRERLERMSGVPVATAHYEQVRAVGEADALVLSGSNAPWAEHDPHALRRLGRAVRTFGGPVLGICAGMQLQAMFAGGSVRSFAPVARGEFRTVDVLDDADLLSGLPRRPSFFERHTDRVVDLPPGFRVLARSKACGIEAIADVGRRWWGTQFHPEEFSSEHPHGERVLRNFFELARQP